MSTSTGDGTAQAFPNPLHPLPSAPPLQGDRKRVALITGAARGIGLAIACRLASDGLDVALNDIDLVKLDEAVTTVGSVGTTTTTVFSVVGDVSKEEFVKEMIDIVVEHFGYLDVVVANAGINFAKSFVDITADDFDTIMGINARGVYLCYKYGALHLIKQGTGGKLIAAGSKNGAQASPMLSIYSASKFAIRGINQGAALELAKHGITANVYAPGKIDTELYAEVALQRQHLSSSNTPIDPDAAVKTVPLGRLGVPEDVANLVSFLASRDSDYITGQSIDVSGGNLLS